MKKCLLLISLFVLVAAGCKGQQNANPTGFSCPLPSANGYTILNPIGSTTNGPVNALTYKDPTPGANTFCYYAQAVDTTPSPALVSIASNVVMVTVTGSESVTLNWTAPTTGVTPTGYILSRVQATVVTIAPPAVGTVTAAELAKPEPQTQETAVARPLRLGATVSR